MKNSLERLTEVRHRLDEVSPSFCLAKWRQVTLHLYRGTTQSCHHVKSHFIQEKNLVSPSRLHNTPEKLKAREQMLSGIRPKECEYCWKMEDLGQISDRVIKSSSQWAWQDWQSILKNPLSVETLPTYLEIAFDSTCQFKCMYCSPDFSSSWQAEYKKYGGYPTITGHYKAEMDPLLPAGGSKIYTEEFWKWWPEISSHLHHIRVTGGEPFLSKDVLLLMDEIIQNPKMNLAFSINSNFGFSTEQMTKFITRILQLKKNVKQVNIFASIDSIGAQAEYIRFGLNAQQFKSNIDLVLSSAEAQLRLVFMISVNSLSLPGLKRLLEVILYFKKKFPQHSIGLDTPYLKNPAFMSVQLLPPDFQPYLEQAIEYMKKNKSLDQSGFTEVEIEKLVAILELMQKKRFGKMMSALLMRDFYKFYAEYDRRRGTRFEETFPEFLDFWSSCKKYAVI